MTIGLPIDRHLTDIIADRFDAGVRLGEQIAQDMIAVRYRATAQMAINRVALWCGSGRICAWRSLQAPPISRRGQEDGSMQADVQAVLELNLLHLGRLGQGQRILGIHAQVAHRTLQLGVAEQDLNRSQIA